MLAFARNSIGRLDAFIWAAVTVFFLLCALASGGDIVLTLGASLGVIIAMVFIGISVEAVIETLRNTRYLGTVAGFITNGPELVVLVVGLVAGDALFGASTPLGSNIMNPVMLLAAAISCGTLLRLLYTNTLYAVFSILLTATLAGGFYFLPQGAYKIWLLVALFVTLILFFFRPKEKEEEEVEPALSRWALLPALALLLFAGYWLDPIVEFAGEVSGAPKGLIGFLILAALSSWPEFKSCLALFRRGRIEAAGLNIFVSNITNIWLAVAGVLAHLFLGL